MKVQSVALTMAVSLGVVGAIQGCSVEADPVTGGAGTAGQGTGTSGSSTSTSGSSTVGGTGNTAGTSGATAGTTGTASCDNVAACGGTLTGKWNVSSSCLAISGQLDMGDAGLDPTACKMAPITGTATVTGSLTLNANGTVKDETVTKYDIKVDLEKNCLMLSGTAINCMGAANAVGSAGFKGATCTESAGGGCACTATATSGEQKGTPGVATPTPATIGNYMVANNTVALTTDSGDITYDYCVAGGTLKLSPKPGLATVFKGQIAFTPDGGGGGTGGAGGGGSGGSSSVAGSSSTGGSGTAGSGGSGTAGTGTAGTGAGGGGSGTKVDGPCDIYAAANMPCAAAYSTIRSLRKAYTGPLLQIRTGSTQKNTGTGGMLKDIGQTADGFVDTALIESSCMGTICTVAKLYDQSGNGNDIGRAPAGNTAGGATGAEDDWESIANNAQGVVTAGGKKAFALYMIRHDGYRTALGVTGKNVPKGKVPQGIYMVADGTHFGDACCWDFGNVTPNPKQYADMNTLFFGKAFWGSGAGQAPWFMADFEAGVWAGGSKNGDPGWGAIGGNITSNPANPSMNGVPFAMGVLKTQDSPSKWSLKSANTATATMMTTSYEGAMPKSISNAGGIVLGVGGDNSNNSFGTFYEGAIVSGFPTNETDNAILANVKAVGYKK
jgi:non-reducing end alpha-L-arabinofuranosidase